MDYSEHSTVLMVRKLAHLAPNTRPLNAVQIIRCKCGCASVPDIGPWRGGGSQEDSFVSVRDATIFGVGGGKKGKRKEKEVRLGYKKGSIMVVMEAHIALYAGTT